MKKAILIALTIVMALAPLAPSGAAAKVVRLGTDPAGDGPPALDVTFLDVTRTGDDLEIRIGIDTMLPAIGGYPEGPGLEWIFKVGKRVFIAEAVAAYPTPKFFFFELKDGSFQQLESPTGTYASEDGFARMLVPLTLIGAKTGTKIGGYRDPLAEIDKTNGTDVDSHIHTDGTQYLDDMKTTKSYVVP